MTHPSPSDPYVSHDPSPRSRLLRRLGGLGPRQALVVGALLLAAIGVFDYAIGAEVVFTSLYLLPVSITAWYSGRRWGAAAAVLSTGVWLTANLSAGLRYSQPEIYVWNSLMTLGPLLLVAYLTSSLRQALLNEQRLARTDYVSGALNARAFYETLQVEIARVNRYGHPLTVAYLDLDSFKAVNDQLGHRAGDEVLRTVVATLRSVLRAGEAVARLGGDEFGLLLPETGEAEARAALKKVVGCLRQTMDAHGWPITFSIGVVICRGPGVRVEEVMRQADARMYQAKLAGKDGIQFGEAPAPAQAAEPARDRL